MEFTIEDGKLFMLQTRNGKRTAQAALQIACDLVDEGVIDEKTAVLRVEPKQLDTLLHPQFDAAALKAAQAIGKGLAASPGSACGRVVFSAEDAEEKVKDDAWKKVVLEMCIRDRVMTFIWRLASAQPMKRLKLAFSVEATVAIWPS